MKRAMKFAAQCFLCSLVYFSGCDKPKAVKPKPVPAPAYIPMPDSTSAQSSKVDYAAERAKFHTALRTREPAPQKFHAETPPAGVREVAYPSNGLQLKAWITDPPTDGKLHRAIIYCHGGFSFGTDDWEQSQPYRDAGFIVMMPMLRGENGNPGDFEMFYGEVDDAIAAGNYLANLPGVDKKHLFIAGHSAGGTIANLASLLPSPFAAAASFGGHLEIKDFLADPSFRAITPFDPDDAGEVRMRSAQSFLPAIRTPLLVVAGSQEGWLVPSLRALERRPPQTQKELLTAVVPGDHFSAVKEAIARSIAFFNKVAP
jgi:dipeptidyl aminopeptidase/acylaminoacyl peptidase